MSAHSETIDDGSSSTTSRLRIAIAGCAHGEMDKIYAELASREHRFGYKADLLICCGDYQAIRNYGDLRHMAVSDKYRQLQTFYKYYSGEAIAPVLTLFIGGNHESSGYMCELPNGGWVAPNIYYMGFANVVQFAGVRIAGLSGIYKSHDFYKGHFEFPPFDNNSMRSVYHVRAIDHFRLKQLKDERIDIMISHDWPCGITDFGNVNALLNIKPFLRDDINNRRLGNPAAMSLLVNELRPRYWFAAHMHVRFDAHVPHADGSETHFLALDKPLPRRQFLDVIEIEARNGLRQLCYDPTWLAILRSTDVLTNIENRIRYMPGPGGPDGERYDFRPTDDERQSSIDCIFAYTSSSDLTIPINSFRRTAPIHQPTDTLRNARASAYYRNPQSSEFCAKLNILDLNEMFCARSNDVGNPVYLTEEQSTIAIASNPDEIDVGEFNDDFVVIDTTPCNST